MANGLEVLDNPLTFPGLNIFVSIFVGLILLAFKKKEYIDFYWSLFGTIICILIFITSVLALYSLCQGNIPGDFQDLKQHDDILFPKVCMTHPLLIMGLVWLIFYIIGCVYYFWYMDNEEFSIDVKLITLLIVTTFAGVYTIGLCEFWATLRLVSYNNKMPYGQMPYTKVVHDFIRQYARI